MKTCHLHPNEEHDKDESRGGERSSISKGGGEYSTTDGGDCYSSDLRQFCIIIIPANKQKQIKADEGLGPSCDNDRALSRIAIMFKQRGNRTALPRVARKRSNKTNKQILDLATEKEKETNKQLKRKEKKKFSAEQ